MYIDTEKAKAETMCTERNSSFSMRQHVSEEENYDLVVFPPKKALRIDNFQLIGA